MSTDPLPSLAPVVLWFYMDFLSRIYRGCRLSNDVPFSGEPAARTVR
jgi:hypothetical protein